MKSSVLLGVALAAILHPFGAADGSSGPYQVQDIETWQDSESSSHPNRFLQWGRKLFFSANVGARDGRWALDMDSMEIELLEEAALGSSNVSVPSGPYVFWITRDSEQYLRLVRSDGSAAGTITLASFPSPLPSYLVPSDFAAIARGGVVFMGYQNETGFEPWYSDGTPAGTFRLADINPGASSSSPSGFTALGDEVCFQAAGPGTGLHCTDGTSAGTRQVATFAYIRDEPTVFRRVGPRLLFVAAEDFDSIPQLYGTDGTTAATTPLTSFPTAGAIHSAILVDDSFAHFVADDVVHGLELWQSDGTPGGTRRISDFGYALAFDDEIEHRVARIGSTTYFVASDGLSPTTLWKSTGSPASTAKALDIDAETDFIGSILAAGGKILLPLEGREGTEIHSVDPSTGIARILVDACPGSCSGYLGLPIAAEGRLFFEASLGLGREIFVTTGTPEGTLQATNTPEGSSQLDASWPNLAVDGDRIFYVGSTPSNGAELRVAETPEAPSTLVADLTFGGQGSWPDQLSRAGQRAVFVHCADASPRLASSQGEPQDVVDLGAVTGNCDIGAFPTRLLSLGERALVFEPEGPNARVRGTDGTPAGTITLFEGQSFEHELVEIVAAGDRAWFVERTPSEDLLHSTDGTLAGTRLEASLAGSSRRFTGGLTWTGNGVVFVCWDEVSQSSRVCVFDEDSDDLTTAPGVYWAAFDLRDRSPFQVFDGAIYYLGAFTASTLVRLDLDTNAAETILALPDTSEIFGFAAAGDGLRILVHGENSVDLYASDGTGPGTGFVKALGRAVSQPADFPWSALPLGSRLVFTAATEEEGAEVWVTDGTGAGTFLLPGSITGPESTESVLHFATGSHLFLTARERGKGVELRRVAIDSGLNERLTDIAPGPQSSGPGSAVLVGDRLLFRADDGFHGAELWALPLTGDECPASARTLCLGGGRFQLEAYWRDFQGNAGDGVAVPLTSDTGYFWFFDPANVETMIKILDGVGVNNRHWVFYGALSNVEYTIDVTDNLNRVKRRYTNPPGRYASIGDADAFTPDGSPTSEPADPRPIGLALAATSASSYEPVTGSCTPSEARLCLQQGRFAVEATWRDFEGHTGIGTAVPLSADTGYFWFFWDANVEVILKVLDGRPVNDKFWVYYGALSNVEYTLTVTDTLTGDVKTYFNPAGRFASVGDNFAF